MNHESFVVLFVILSVCLGALPSGALATDELEQQAAALSDLRVRIGDIESSLRDDQIDLDDAQNNLRSRELEISNTITLITKLEGEMTVKKDMIADLRTRKTAQEASIANHADALTKQLRTAYMVGKSEYLKLLLNQEDPVRIGRMLKYHEYFSRARSARLSLATAELAELATLQQAIKLENENFSILKSQTNGKLDRLEEIREQRATIVAKLESRIAEQSGVLDNLKNDEQKLQALLDRLEQAQSATFTPTLDGPPFAELTNQLVWPVDGRITRDFGEVRDNSAFTWQGVMIVAPGGTPVRAISQGRVIFADWFQHLGLLLIVDHGNAYMSLYGHNQTLFKTVGDWVVTNEIVAGVGDSGGRNVNALYFEVRHQGRPQDPARWCHTQDS